MCKNVKLTLFTVGKDEKNTKEGTGNWIQCMHYGMPKGTSKVKVMPNSEKKSSL